MDIALFYSSRQTKKGLCPTSLRTVIAERAKNRWRLLHMFTRRHVYHCNFIYESQITVWELSVQARGTSHSIKATRRLMMCSLHVNSPRQAWHIQWTLMQETRSRRPEAETTCRASAFSSAMCGRLPSIPWACLCSVPLPVQCGYSNVNRGKGAPLYISSASGPASSCDSRNMYQFWKL